jgi:hypothetical protein
LDIADKVGVMVANEAEEEKGRTEEEIANAKRAKAQKKKVAFSIIIVDG